MDFLMHLPIRIKNPLLQGSRLQISTNKKEHLCIRGFLVHTVSRDLQSRPN